MADKFEYSFQVPFHQVDHAGIMFFAHLFTHAHDAYAALMENCSSSLQQIIEQGVYAIPLVHTEANYHAPMRHGDRISVNLGVERLGNSSFRLAYRFHCHDMLCADAGTDHVFITVENGKPAAIPAALRDSLSRYLEIPASDPTVDTKSG